MISRRHSDAAKWKGQFMMKTHVMRLMMATWVVGLVTRVSVSVRAEEPVTSAQSGTEIQAFMAMSLEDLLDTPVYAASKREQNRATVPAFVTVITSEDIQRYGYRTLADIIASVGPFYQSNDRNYRALGSRGFSRPGDYNARILLLLNGHRMNDPLFDSAVPISSPDMAVDVDLIDRVEIIRGPGSSLYGTSAIFAVINVITRTGASMKGTEMGASYGSFDTWNGRFSYGSVLSNGMDLVISGTRGEQGGQKLYFSEYDSPEFNNGITPAAADAGESMNTYIRAASSNLTIQAGFSDHKDYIPTASYDTVFGSDDTFTDDRYIFIDLTRDFDLTPDCSGMVRVGYDEYSYKGDYLYDYSAMGDLSELVVNKDDVVGEWWSTELQCRYDGIDRNILLAGAEYRLNTRMDYLNYDDGARDEPYFDLSVDSWVWAIYAQDDITLSDNAQLTVGARYDSYELGGDAVSPRTGLIFGPFGDTTIKLLYGEAFRAPNVYETSWNFPGQQVGNADLDPETVQTYEAILEQKLTANVVLTASAFEYDMTDMITLVDEGDGVLIYENTDEATAIGGELESLVRLHNGIETRVSYTCTEAEDSNTHEHLTNSPRNLGKVNVSAPVVSRALYAGAEVQYIGERLNASREPVDAYCVANLTLSSRHLWKNADFSVSVYNVFDTTYYDPGYQQHVESEIEQDGRSYRTKLTYRF